MYEILECKPRIEINLFPSTYDVCIRPYRTREQLVSNFYCISKTKHYCHCNIMYIEVRDSITSLRAPFGLSLHGIVRL